MGLVRFFLAAVMGALVACFLPRPGILASTQELIGFLSLIMAGLLPAMILTATILRGGGLSAKRVEEYGGALRQQLRFWAVLFGAAGLATFGVVGLKIFSASGVNFNTDLYFVNITPEGVTSFFVCVAGAGLGVVFQRLQRAYRGLVSLLQLNVKMAKTEAIAHDRTLREALEDQGAQSSLSDPYRIK